MVGYLWRRLPSVLATILGVVSLVFFMVRLIPGDPATVILGDYATQEVLAELRHELGLDQPLVVQYFWYLGRLLRGDLGRSLMTKRSVAREITSVFHHTAMLAIAGILVSLVIGIPIGVVAALRRHTWLDYVTMTIAVLGVSVPVFWLAMVLMLIFSLHLGLLPSIGVGEEGNPWSLLKHLVLPALALGMYHSGLLARLTRAAMLEVICQDYIRTARAKGLAEWVVLIRHALRNALMPIVTTLGVNVGLAMGGSVLMETVFARPGMGTLLIEATMNRDYPLVQGVFLVFSTSFVLINLLVDLSYSAIDPRVQVKGKR
jgi:peptide/nickel transport system permease protein